MADCPRIAACPFFNDKMADVPAMAGMFKRKYCQGDNSQCARWMVGSAGKTCPADLYPNQVDRAKAILAGG